uniref:U296g n=1 Tax=Mycobacterium leprae TaxID=1769 RepID=Q50146_MYCLR|nr:u296g [Mycobacterium leprae]CAB08418.1 unknown [Mycobacterium leprae]
MICVSVPFAVSVHRRIYSCVWPSAAFFRVCGVGTDVDEALTGYTWLRVTSWFFAFSPSAEAGVYQASNYAVLNHANHLRNNMLTVSDTAVDISSALNQAD